MKTTNQNKQEEFQDLIYTSKERAKALLTEYPNAKIEEHYDEIHGDRIRVHLKDTKNSYYRKLMETGMHELSMGFQLALRDKDEYEIIDQIVTELEDERDDQPRRAE